jgi:acetyl-CoA synthetase
MIAAGGAELIFGVVKDPAHGFVLTVGSGGVFTAILKDTVSLLVPSNESTIKQCLTKLKIGKILTGFRGKPATNLDVIVAAVIAVQDYVLAHAATVEEVDVNPLICTQTSAIAVDALIRIAK